MSDRVRVQRIDTLKTVRPYYRRASAKPQLARIRIPALVLNARNDPFLPAAAPGVLGAEFAWCYRPCDELAGDGLNVVPLGGRQVGLYVLDVSGHGVAAAPGTARRSGGAVQPV